MRLPNLTATNSKIKKSTIVFRGLNKLSLINDDELSACYNVSFKDRPCLSCRPPRELKHTLATPKALFAVGDNLAWVDGTSFKYNNVTKGTVTATAKSMLDFNGKIIIMPDKKYYDYTAGTFGTITDIGPDATVPAMDYICVHMNRIFGVKGSTMYASALGQYNNWTTFAGESTDAWAKDVATEGGNFTGIASYQNHPIALKTGITYEVYNNKPDYVTQPVNKIGCLSNNAIIEIDSVLYFAGQRGVYIYAGGSPRLISDNLDDLYTDATLGTDGRYLYASLYNGLQWVLYIYDTSEKLWLQEDNLHVIQFVKIGESCFALASTGELYKFNSGIENGVKWSIETKKFTEEIFNRKGHGKIRMRIDLQSGSSVRIYTKEDGGSWKLQKSFSSTGLQTFYAVLKMEMADYMQIKLEGTGEFKLHGLGREVTIGSDG